MTLTNCLWHIRVVWFYFAILALHGWSLHSQHLQAADQDKRLPNIVFIVADDYGYGSANCLGADPKLIQTPNIDRLAREGRRFVDANTTSSVCSPTRYSALTGRYCWRTSLKHQVLNTFAPLHIETNRLTMASLLKKHGYSTAAVGKWHLGYGASDQSAQWRTDYTGELSPGPLDLGFDYHFGVPSNHGDLTGVFVENRYVYGLQADKIPDSLKLATPVEDADFFQSTYEASDTESGKGGDRILKLDAPRRKNVRVTQVLTKKATNWLHKQSKTQPFFLYFTPVAVHNPVTPSPELTGKSAVGLYGDWIHELDRSVAEVLAALDEMGVADNTLVILTSDNGGVCKPDVERLLQTAAYKAGLRVNGELRGGKHDVWEGGFKVPFLVRWPGHVPAGSKSKQMISLADMLATTAAIVGEQLPDANSAAEDSFNALPAFIGEPDKPIRQDLIVHSANGVFAIRKGPWKWIEGVPFDEVKPAARKAEASQYKPQLYNTLIDPTESHDVSAEHPEVVAELKALLHRYREGGYSRELPPEPVAKPEMPKAALPPAGGKVTFRASLNQMPEAPWQITRGSYKVEDEGVFGIPPEAKSGTPEQGATLRLPVQIENGTIDYEISFRGANRTSLRIECPDRTSFRIEVSRSQFGVTKNPDVGQEKTATERIASKALELKRDQWYPVRIQFSGDSISVSINNVVLTGKHKILAEPKTALNFLVFGETAGFKNLTISQ